MERCKSLMEEAGENEEMLKSNGRRRETEAEGGRLPLGAVKSNGRGWEEAGEKEAERRGSLPRGDVKV